MSQTADGYVIHEGCDHIFFIGFSGAGKSTIARNIGKMFHRRYVDTDKMVELAMGKSVASIFDSAGEEAFRREETAALRRLKRYKSLLVSCGGGIVERPENLDLMHRMGFIVYLDGDLEDSLRQIQRFDKRPDFDGIDEAEELFEHRRPLYSTAADCTIDIRGKSFAEVADTAASILWEYGLL